MCGVVPPGIMRSFFIHGMSVAKLTPGPVMYVRYGTEAHSEPPSTLATTARPLAAKPYSVEVDGSWLRMFTTELSMAEI